MELKINNIGIIAEAKIHLNGLTVLTGANNSGKTTVGRVLYSLVSAVENLQKNALLDKHAYVQSTIDNLLSMFPFYDWTSFLSIEELVIDTKEPPSLEQLLAFIDETIDHMKNVTMASFVKAWKSKKLPRSLAENIFKEFDGQRADIIDKVNSLRNALLKDPELVEYANKRIEKKLNTEFFGQITPLAAQTSNDSKCVLSDGDKEFFKVLLDNSASKKRYYLSPSPFVSAFFVDDGSIIDDLSEKQIQSNEHRTHTQRKPRRYRTGANSEAFLESFRDGSHKDDLMRNLLLAQDTITGELAVEEQTASVMEEINKAVPYGIEWKEGRFVSSDLKIDLRNLAQGSKAFLVIKMLLENGVLRKNSLLVLDEPETHLHPEWQGFLAEATVLLVKHLGCTVLLTTHSPDFVMALDVASRKHKIFEISKFYISKKLKTGLASFDEVNEDVGSTRMNDVYLHLSKPFMTLEPQRLELIHRDEKEDGE